MIWPWRTKELLTEEDRDEARALVQSLGLPICEVSVPISTIRLRELQSILDRLFVLHAISAVAHGFSGERARSWLEQEGLASGATDGELEVLAGASAEVEAYQEQVEGMWALFWAVGLAPSLDPLKKCPDTFAASLPDFREDKMPSTKEWRVRARLRTAKELAKALYVSESLAAAFTGAKSLGRPTPQLDGGVAANHRARALAWSAGLTSTWQEPVAVRKIWWRKR